MMSLPGAVAKAVFDIVWDYFRVKNTAGEERMIEHGIEMHHVSSTGNSRSFPDDIEKDFGYQNQSYPTDSEHNDQTVVRSESSPETISLFQFLEARFNSTKLRPALDSFMATFPIFSGTLRRLPYALLPFALSQFILVEALSYTGWINVFSGWLAKVVGFSVPATVFVVGVVSIILCNCSGTNIGATILLVKVLQHPNFASRSGMTPKVRTGGMLALAVGSNIGAVSFTFSASLAGAFPTLIR